MALALLPHNGMTFTENQHGTAVLEKLRSQRDLVRCCDVILHVATKQFHAHRCVIAACSPYFDSIFKASKTVKEQLTISSQDAEVFRCLLAYMYTGTVVVDRTNVAELLRLANKLLIAKLKEHCAEYLERYLDVTNCLTVRDMATKFSLEALEKTTGIYIGLHIAEIIEGEEILELAHNKLEDFIKNPIWQLESDQTLLLVTRWVDHAPETRERNLRSLLTWVEWNSVDVEASRQLAQDHVLYSRSRLALFFLLEALNNNGLLPSDLLAQYYKLKTKFCESSGSTVDAERFLSLAISTAIDELQDNETLGNAADINFLNQQNHAQDKEELSHFNLCKSVLNENVHDNVNHDLQPTRASAGQNHNLEDSREENAISLEDKKNHSVSEDQNQFDKKPIIDNSSHFGQLPVWHQEGNFYAQDESLSSDSNQLYGPQHFYGQSFELVKGQIFKNPSSDSYNSRMGRPSQQMYSRESLPTSAGAGGVFSSAMSYYVSNYNPDTDVAIEDDQSTQSFQYDEGINQGMNLYPSRPVDAKNQTCTLSETQNQNDGAYNKSYYQDNSSTYQDETSTYQDNSSINQTINSRQQTALYYNDNSSDTQVSNCPQDMTIQHQFYNNAVVNEQSKTQFSNLNDKENTETHFINSEKKDFFTQIAHQDSQSQFCSQNSMISNRLDHFEDDTASHNLSIITEDSVDTNNFAQRQKASSIDMQSYSHYFSSNCNLGEKETLDDDLKYEQNKEHLSLELPEVKRTSLEGKEIEQTLNNNLDDPDDPGCVLDDICPPDQDLDVNTPRQVQFKINRRLSLTNFVQRFQRSRLEQNSGTNPIDKFQSTSLTQQSGNENKNDNPVFNDNEEVSCNSLIIAESNMNLQESLENTKENFRRTSSRIRKGEKSLEESPVETAKIACELCNVAFNIKRDYFKHMKEHFPGPPHQCDSCKSTFQRIYHLLDHRTLHQDLRSHKCTICNFSTNKKFNLKEHMRLHNKNRAYKCKTCGKQFSREQILRNHETKHTNNRPFLCETCGWSAKTKNALFVHNKKHTGDLMKCQFPGCNYTTPKTSHLKDHMTRHSNIRKFACSQCSREFQTQSKLSRHLLTHNPEKPIKCSFCDYSTHRNDRLTSHLKNKHMEINIVKKLPGKKQGKKKTMNNLGHYENPKAKKRKKKNLLTKECSQNELFSDLENSNVSLQPQLPGTPPPTTLSEFPHSPTQYTNFPHSNHDHPDDTLMIGTGQSLGQDDKAHAGSWGGLGPAVGPGLSSPVTDVLPSLQPSPSGMHRGLGPPSLVCEDTYQSPTYQSSSTSHFEALSPHSSLPYSNGQHTDESPLNFASYMKYN